MDDKIVAGAVDIIVKHTLKSAYTINAKVILCQTKDI